MTSVQVLICGNRIHPICGSEICVHVFCSSRDQMHAARGGRRRGIFECKRRRGVVCRGRRWGIFECERRRGVVCRGRRWVCRRRWDVEWDIECKRRLSVVRGR